MQIYVLISCRGVAQMIKHRTRTLPKQVRSSGAARDFSPRVNFQCRLSCDVRAPLCAIACIYICAHVARQRSRSPCQKSMDYGNTRTPSMHPWLGSATLSQLAFPGEGNPNFPREKSHWENTVVKSKTFFLFLKYVPFLMKKCSDFIL